GGGPAESIAYDLSIRGDDMSARPRLAVAALHFLHVFAVGAQERTICGRERARAWADSTGWLVGSNFAPSTAINQLDMWQAATFDPRTIDRELGWAESLGFNTMRVFLHNLLWAQDPKGFLNRMDQLLTIAQRRD